MEKNNKSQKQKRPFKSKGEIYWWQPDKGQKQFKKTILLWRI